MKMPVLFVVTMNEMCTPPSRPTSRKSNPCTIGSLRRDLGGGSSI